jgi:hypothetical protein
MKFAIFASLFLVAGCTAQPEPIVDTKGVNMAAYAVDLEECRQYATQVPVMTGVAKGTAAARLMNWRRVVMRSVISLFLLAKLKGSMEPKQSFRGRLATLILLHRQLSFASAVTICVRPAPLVGPVKL